jgi:hypothetical protein
MRHIINTKVILVCFLFALGCKSKHIDLPEGIITEDKMINLIADMQLLEAAHKSNSLSNLEQQAMRDTSFTIVLNKHNVTYEEYDSSLRVYTRYPQLFGEMMEKVGDKLNTTQ